MVRSGRTAEGVAELGRAAAADPADARIAYVYAIGLDALGKKDAALRTLDEALARRPEDRDVLVALVTLNRDAGRRETARRYARRLVALDPQDAEAATLLRSLE
jgi:Flp pilus assembly protein TadD